MIASEEACRVRKGDSGPWLAVVLHRGSCCKWQVIQDKSTQTVSQTQRSREVMLWDCWEGRVELPISTKGARIKE